jgi:hypothetical protein
MAFSLCGVRRLWAGLRRAAIAWLAEGVGRYFCDYLAAGDPYW